MNFNEQGNENLTKHFIDRGHEFLPLDKWGRWDKEVPEHIESEYGRMILDVFFEVIAILNTGDMEKAKFHMDTQDFSGTPHYVLLTMVVVYCGEEFTEYIKKCQCS